MVRDGPRRRAVARPRRRPPSASTGRSPGPPPRRGSGPRSRTRRRPSISPPRPAASAPAPGRARGRPAPRRSPSSAWAAEIGWHRAGDAAQFSVTAHLVGADEEPAELGASARLRWPPDGARSGQALTDAVKELDAALVAAGWTPLARGGAWYARRYAWQPGAQPGATTDARARTRHRELYEAAFARQADRTQRLRSTIADRLAPDPPDEGDHS